MNRYKMKPGTTISDIEKYAEENNLGFNTSGTWVSDDAEYVLRIGLEATILLAIAFPKDLEKWDDFKHVLVLDEDFGQPYVPFYKQLENPNRKPFLYLKSVIEEYNKKMDRLPFLEKTT